ncbi:hypothetical protein ACQY0O_000826 [Thecaphora frezii]
MQGQIRSNDPDKLLPTLKDQPSLLDVGPVGNAAGPPFGTWLVVIIVNKVFLS